MRSLTADTRRHRSGFTLVEVLVGSAILVLLLGAFVTIAERVRAQDQQGERLDQAARAVDELLTQWSLSGGAFPVGAEGLLPGDSHLSWRTDLLADKVSELIGVVRLTVVSPTQTEQKTLPILTIDLVQPIDPSLLPQEDLDEATP